MLIHSFSATQVKSPVSLAASFVVIKFLFSLLLVSSIWKCVIYLNRKKKEEKDMCPIPACQLRKYTVCCNAVSQNCISTNDRLNSQ